MNGVKGYLNCLVLVLIIDTVGSFSMSHKPIEISTGGGMQDVGLPSSVRLDREGPSQSDVARVTGLAAIMGMVLLTSAPALAERE